MEISVPDLLVMSHPGYRYIVTRRDVDEHEIPTIVDYTRCMTERFEFYGQMDVTPPDLFKHLTKAFRTLCESDEPDEVFPTRALLPRLLEEYEATMNNMSRAFPVDMHIKNHYSDTSEVLYELYDQLTGGEDND